MITNQDKLPYSVTSVLKPRTKDSQQLRLQYLCSLINNCHIKMLQFEQFRFRCNRCNCSHINTAICHADVYLPTIVAFCQHIFQQMFAETRITRQFTPHPYIVHLRQNGRKRPAYLVHRPISISQQQHLCGRTSIKMLHHPPQGTRSLSGSRRPHQQEIVTGSLRFQRPAAIKEDNPKYMLRKVVSIVSCSTA